MYPKITLLGAAFILATSLSSSAQSFVPANIDFELGTTVDWTYYKGTVATGHVFSLVTTTPSTGLQALTSGTGTDSYGGFPVVGYGLYSLKLAHDTIDNNADGASYNIHVPAGGSYSFVYHYAAVLEDPAHPYSIQPSLEVTATDSATGAALPSGAASIVPTMGGFLLSTTGTDVYYKPWTTATINLAGYGGHTVTVKFVVSACATGSHFGYGYLDASGCFETSEMLPYGAPSATVTAPGDYASYRWTDSATFMASLGTTATVTIPAPTTRTTYAVILTPYSGHGAPDTLYTTVTIAAPTSASSIVAGKAAINIYPNPTSGDLDIQWSDQQTGAAQLQVMDVTGRVVSSSAFNLNAASGTKHLNLGALNRGIYMVNINSATINYCGRVVIQK